jgi:RNA ligase (TIGR02306 family)
LGITKYVAPIPEELTGKVSHMDTTAYETRFVKHDVENFHTFKDEFVDGEPVDLTEKVNGSQINVMKDAEGGITLTSKYLGQEGLAIDEDPDNKYWRALNNSGLREEFQRWAGANIQVIGEAIPFAKGYPYGLTEPTIRIYRLVIDGHEVPVSEVMDSPVWRAFRAVWVPFIATVPFDPMTFAEHAKGRELVSGKELHIREGIVITPMTPRRSSEGHGLSIKWLNPKYRGSPEEIS